MPDTETTSIGVHALLITTDGKIILQQRDTNIRIVNSGRITMFGGTVKAEENLLVGLKRELKEELRLDFEDYFIKKLGTFYKTIKLDGIDYTIHVFIIENIDPKKLILYEGADIVIGKVEELSKNMLLTRITKLALNSYLYRSRHAPG